MNIQEKRNIYIEIKERLEKEVIGVENMRLDKEYMTLWDLQDNCDPLFFELVGLKRFYKHLELLCRS